MVLDDALIRKAISDTSKWASEADSDALWESVQKLSAAYSVGQYDVHRRQGSMPRV